MSDTIQDTTPDELMQAFRGRSLKSMLVFTIIVHAVLILGASIPGIVKNLAASEAEKLTPEQRADLALKEARTSIQEIAKRHNINAQDLSARFAPSSPKTTTPEAPSPAAPTPAPEPEAPKSAIEKELETTAEGPTTPPIPATDDEDLFK